MLVQNRSKLCGMSVSGQSLWRRGDFHRFVGMFGRFRCYIWNLIFQNQTAGAEHSGAPFFSTTSLRTASGWTESSVFGIMCRILRMRLFRTALLGKPLYRNAIHNIFAVLASVHCSRRRSSTRSRKRKFDTARLNCIGFCSARLENGQMRKHRKFQFRSSFDGLCQRFLWI